jgi:hypothetical protein
MDPLTQGLAGLSLAVVIFGAILAILWILVPFAVFGIKPLLRRLIVHLDNIERQNVEVIAALRDLRAMPVQQPVVIRDERPLP